MITNHRRCFLGLDLGQRADPSALVLVERFWEQASVGQFISTGADGRWWFIVRGAERFRLGTPYPDIVTRTKRVAQMPIVEQGCTIVVDGTGVGAPVVDLIRRAHIGCSIAPVLITGGDRPNSHLSGGYESVPRSQLLTNMVVLAQQHRLLFADGLKEARALKRELGSLKLAGGKGSTEVHDDLAFAVALALWKAKIG